MSKIDNKTFEEYKTITNKVIRLLMDEHASSNYSIDIIYNIIHGFPYAFHDHGYMYQGKFYDNLSDMPSDGFIEYIHRYCNKAYIDETDLKLRARYNNSVANKFQGMLCECNSDGKE